MFDLEMAGDKALIADFGEAPQAVTRAMVRALNRSIASGRTVMVRGIAGDIGLRSKDVREALRPREATLSRPEASLAASLKRIPLIEFRARGAEPSRGKGRGVTYRIGGASKRLEHAFIATMSSGHRGVFMRTHALLPGQSGPRFSSRKSKGAWSPNLPIKEKHGPSLGRVFAKHRPAGLARVREQFLKVFGHELRFERSLAPGGGSMVSPGAVDAGTE